MKERIFVEDKAGKLLEMSLAQPRQEDVLQKLIERHPELISLDEENLLLVQRELGAVGAETAGERWSLDHLFVTSSAVPVLVEVKRATDTRIRREVIGQIFDYAASGSSVWTADALQAAFEARCHKEELDPDETLAEFSNIGENDDSFWDQVQANLRAGRIKVRIVADKIPDQLARIITFMNEHCDFEVLAVHLGYFEGENGSTTIVPKAIGEGSKAKQRTSSKKPQNEDLVKILEKFSKLGSELSSNSECRGNYVQLTIGRSGRHYEWYIKKNAKELHVAIHFEGGDREDNLAGAESVRSSVESIAKEFQADYFVGPWATKWATAGLIFPLKELSGGKLHDKAARSMARLVEETLAVVK